MSLLTVSFTICKEHVIIFVNWYLLFHLVGSIFEYAEDIPNIIIHSYVLQFNKLSDSFLFKNLFTYSNFEENYSIPIQFFLISDVNFINSLYLMSNHIFSNF